MSDGPGMPNSSELGYQSDASAGLVWAGEGPEGRGQLPPA
jgi:hypothetical protein